MTTSHHYDNAIVKLTAANGQPVYVRVEGISFFMPEQAGTRICFAADSYNYLDVNESPEEVLKRSCDPPSE